MSEDRTVRVALIEDNRLIREGLVSLLSDAGFEVVAAGSTIRLGLLQQLPPRVVLLDHGLRNVNSLRVARQVRKAFPDAGIIVMDLLPLHDDITQFVEAGVSGFIMKSATVEQLVESIRTVDRGGQVLPSEAVSSLFSEIAREAAEQGGPLSSDSVRMTTQEYEVVSLIADGMSHQEVATRLRIVTPMVRSHLHNVLEKLTLHARLQIAADEVEHPRTRAAG